MKKIKSIKIKNSNFFKNNLEIKFNEKLNCIMGSRGTGKSTILYFIKSIVDKEGEENNTIYNLLKNNLGQGIIELEIESENGTVYNIEKSINDEPQPSILPDGKHIPIERIYDDIECDIYEALAIEKIGLDGYSRLELIDKMIDIKQKIENEIGICQSELKQNAIEVKSVKEQFEKVSEQLINFENAEEDLLKHKKNLPIEVSQLENDNFKIKESEEKTRNIEKKYFKELKEMINESKTDLENEQIVCKEKLTDLKETHIFLNKEIISEVEKVVTNFYEVLYSDLDKKIVELSKLDTKVDEIYNSLIVKHSNQHSEFVKLKLRFEKNKDYYDRYEKLSKRIQQREMLIKEKEKINKKLTKHKNQRSQLMESLNEFQDKIYNERLQKIKELNKYLNGDVIITITKGGLINEYNEKLKIALKGSGMKYSVLGQKIIDNFRPSELARIINDGKFDKLKSIFGIDTDRARSLIAGLINKDEIYEIESLNCPDLIEFKLKVDITGEKENLQITDYKRTDELSTGQRCTAVLPIIFAVSQNPLIIDQPEDNLDNKYITKTIQDIIAKMKNQRQLIFITHNANIPVLSESEQNVFLTFENQNSYIKNTNGVGTVDDVKENILSILEGGKEAFQERERRYKELLK